MRFGISDIEFNSFTVAGDSIRKLSAIVQSTPQTCEGIEITGFEFDRPTVTIDRLCHFSRCFKSFTEIVQSFWKVGFQAQSFLIAGDRIGNFALFVQDNCQIAASDRIGWQFLNRLLAIS